MVAAGQNSSSSRRRFWVLLTIALIGYEFALYQHLIWEVPLRPDFVLELHPGQAMLGFVPMQGLGVARGSTLTAGDYLATATGPVEFRDFPSGELTDHRLSAKDRVAGPKQPIFDAGPTYPPDMLTGGSREFHPLPQAMPNPTYFFLHNGRLIYLAEQTLHCCDRATNRLLWMKGGISGVTRVDGDYAFVFRPSIDPESQKTVFKPSFLDLRDGNFLEVEAPAEVYEVLDVSPKRELVLYALADGFQLSRLRTGEALWKRTIPEVGTRRLTFSTDGESLVSWFLSETGDLSCSRIRSADGEILESVDRRTSPEAVRHPAVAVVGDRVGIFQHMHGDTTTKPRYYDIVMTYLMRTGVLGSSKTVDSWLGLYDLERRAWVGVLKTTHAKLFIDPQGRGLALQSDGAGGSPPQVEMYGMPPRRDWGWFAGRGVGLPALGVLMIAGYRAGVRWRRRRRAVTVSTSDRYALSPG